MQWGFPRTNENSQGQITNKKTKLHLAKIISGDSPDRDHQEQP